MKQSSYDFLVIGSGVVGIAIAIELKRRFPQDKVAILEKENELAYHSSGRNSGVLHAGFYYTADSLKAEFTRMGCAYLKDYCETKKLKLFKCGKLVVVKRREELDALDELFRRAKANGVELHEVSSKEAKEIEPRVITYERAAWSPTTASMDPIEVMKSMADDAQKMGIEILFSTKFQSRSEDGILTNKGPLSVGFVINAAGLYADKIAMAYGFSKDYRILPFKGLYLYSSSQEKLRTHIYPVPNLKNPFLGVHHTLTVDGASKIGPTAVPAFWRENYSLFERFSGSEFLRITADEVSLFIKNDFNFRDLALEEIKKYSRKKLVEEAALMAEGINISDYTKWGRPGIRAQLFNFKTRKLEMDFKLEGDSKSLHVLNAVSPAFTCSQPFASHIVDQMSRSGKVQSFQLQKRE